MRIKRLFLLPKESDLKAVQKEITMKRRNMRMGFVRINLGRGDRYSHRCDQKKGDGAAY